MEIVGLITLVFVLCLVIKAFSKGVSYFYPTPEEKGDDGERYIAKLLETKLSSEYTIFNNLYLPLADKSTTQIDHVVVSPYGIFVIETKNFSGWIFASENSRKWTQVLYQAKSVFQNPIRQNYRHICSLAYVLRLNKNIFHNVVIFNDSCEFRVGMPDGVVYASMTARYIQSFKETLLTPEQITKIENALSAWQDYTPPDARARHTFHLKQRHEGVKITDAAPQCPYCGGEMALRHRKDGKGSFYGCKRYPQCRGIINAR